MTSGCRQVIQTCETESLNVTKNCSLLEMYCFNCIAHESDYKNENIVIISKNSETAWYKKLHFDILRRMAGLCRESHIFSRRRSDRNPVQSIVKQLGIGFMSCPPADAKNTYETLCYICLPILCLTHWLKACPHCNRTLSRLNVLWLEQVSI